MRDHGADLGLAFDGDADRCFFVDEHANGLSGSLITALVANGMLERYPGATIIYNLIVLTTVPEVSGSTAASRCGPASATPSSRRPWPRPAPSSAASSPATTTSATTTTPTRGWWRRWSSWTRCRSPGVPLSELLPPLRRYVDSGEINSEVEDQAGDDRGASRPRSPTGGRTGWTASRSSTSDWWFNVRAVEHRAAAPAERGGADRGAARGADRTRAGRHPGAPVGRPEEE